MALSRILQRLDPLTVIVGGRVNVTTPGVAVQFPSQACKWCRVQALTDNGNVVAIAGSAVDAADNSENGVFLFAGQYQDFDIDNLDLLYVDSRAAGEGVSYVYGS